MSTYQADYEMWGTVRVEANTADEARRILKHALIRVTAPGIEVEEFDIEELTISGIEPAS